MIAVPLLVLQAAPKQSPVDEFLRTRTALFVRLHSNASDLPAGYEQVHEQPPAKLWPPAEHILSVVGDGKLCYADSSASYSIRLSGETADRSADDVVMELFEHLSSGLADIGLASSQSGGPSMAAYPRAAHFQSWRSADHSFIVTMTAVVDADSDTAFVSRFVHERLE